jgi:hypothetical protein
VIEDCPPTDVDLLANTQCTILISRLRSEPFLLEHQQPILVKVTQVNVIGESEMSAEGSGASIFVPVVPEAPINMVEISSEVTKTTASFAWSDGANGGKPILDYMVEYDLADGSSWTTLETDILQKQYTATGLDQGNTYKFRVYACNQVGYSEASEEIHILTAIIPDAPSDVLTTVVANDIVITWSSPSEDFLQDYGANLLHYTIEIQGGDETSYFTELTHCNGADSGIISSLECSIPISVLLGSPFLLSTNVYARVSASNVVGESQYS